MPEHEESEEGSHTEEEIPWAYQDRAVYSVAALVKEIDSLLFPAPPNGKPKGK